MNAQALAQLLGLLVPLQAEHFDQARVGRGEALADLDGRGFTGAVGAEQAETFSGRHVEIQVVDGDDVLVRLAEMADVQSRPGCAFGHRFSISKDVLFGQNGR